MRLWNRLSMKVCDPLRLSPLNFSTGKVHTPLEETMKRQLRWQTLLVAILFVFGMAVTMRAQEATGRIIGAVTDPRGAVVPGATVTVTNTSTQTTQISRETVTNDDGNYQVLSLPI